MKCLKTGCDLYSVNEGKWVHGDLHEVGGALVFNACFDRNLDAAWNFSDPPRPESTIQTNNYFERRGVIVLDDFSLPPEMLSSLPPMA